MKRQIVDYETARFTALENAVALGLVAFFLICVYLAVAASRFAPWLHL